MSEWREFSAKTVNEALTTALSEMGTTSDKVEYEIVEEEKSGLLGLFSKPAVIRVKVKATLKDVALDFLTSLFSAMNMEVQTELDYQEEENIMNIELFGDNMGPLIGKRGSTLDSIQYLTSLVVNRESESYVKIKIDTENFRARRKETLENLAKNIANKVRRTYRPVYLEPMNPYERRVIHSALQNDKYVETHSEGDDPYRKVVVTLKPGVDTGYERNDYRRGSYGRGRSYNRNGGGGYRKRSYRNSYRQRDYSGDREYSENKDRYSEDDGYLESRDRYSEDHMYSEERGGYSDGYDRSEDSQGYEVQDRNKSSVDYGNEADS